MFLGLISSPDGNVASPWLIASGFLKFMTPGVDLALSIARAGTERLLFFEAMTSSDGLVDGTDNTEKISFWRAEVVSFGSPSM